MPTSYTQHWDPAKYAEQGHFVAELGMPVVKLLSPRDGERILDLGCGDGALTIKLLEFGCSVIGIDASPEMVAAAQARGVDAHVMDGQSLSYTNEFDAVFSNAALHWMLHPAQVLAGVWFALKPGGRFVAEFGAQGNVAAIISALEAALEARGKHAISPWYFPRPEAFKQLLEASGFKVDTLEHHPRPTRLPGDVGGWLQTFAQPYLAALSEAERVSVISEIVERLRPELCDPEGDWYADYVRLRFAAYKQEPSV